MSIYHKHENAKRARKDVRSSRAGITADYELPDMGAENLTWVLWKSSSPLNH